MTGAIKAYRAPRLEALSLRSTRDIDLGAAIHVEIHLGGLLS
jgi:hypothetical protein